jgi:hypothetical protein
MFLFSKGTPCYGLKRMIISSNRIRDGILLEDFVWLFSLPYFVPANLRETHILSILTHFYSSEFRKSVLVKRESLRLDQRTGYGS